MRVTRYCRVSRLSFIVYRLSFIVSLAENPKQPRFSKFADMHAKEKGHTDSEDEVSEDDIYIYMYIYVHIYIYVCVYVYKRLYHAMIS